MNLNDLLLGESVDLDRTLVLRHQPSEPSFRKALPLLAGERLDLFNAYQSAQSGPLENSIQNQMGGFVASFMAYGAGKAVYVGTFEIRGSRPVDRKAFWQIPKNKELKTLGARGFDSRITRDHILWFDLKLTDIMADWRGRLVVAWPPPERSWYRRAHKNDMPVVAIREESAFAPDIPNWRDIDYSWAELAILPRSVRAALAQWRGIYLIWDDSDGKAYVGSAYGANNILGRWEQYASSGHGGNVLLRKRDPARFHFTILERVSPDMDDAGVIELETGWKNRLHTRKPFGLNIN